MSERIKVTDPLPKLRELSKSEKDAIRVRLESGDIDAHKLASEFDCSKQQIAGFKAWLKR